MSERAVGNKDSWAKACVNGDDGSVLGMEFADDVFEFREGFAEQKEFGNDGNGVGPVGSRRELIVFRDFVVGGEVEERFEKG